MKFSKIAAALTLATISVGALAGGPLYIHEKTMQPYKWDTSKGSIPVWTDGGKLIKDKDGNDVQSFTVLEQGTVFNQDVTLPDGTILPKYVALDRDYTFLTIEQANKVTAHAIGEWTNVETSTFAMDVRGTIEEKLGISDVTPENVDQIYGAENGYGFWVNYDTDGQILEQYFGIPRTQVLGIAFPEWADEETGEILEATALMNGWFVHVNDTEGEQVGGVFTHEFGHALNMSHSQANGHLAYMAKGYRPMYDGVPGCDGTNKFVGSRFDGSIAQASWIETMFPFIDVRSIAGTAQSTVNVTDDKVNISDLYPTAEYLSEYGSISGKLLTKDGVEYSGINMVLRNLDDPYEDVITQQSGNMTQGLMGPDGKFTINGLTPGARYALYIDTIKAGGYPTSPTNIISEPEYWNVGESENPGEDNACMLTEIVVEAGETKELEMRFNGYHDGIQYTPLVQAFILDHAKNGKKALGTTSSGIPFMYDSVQNTFETLADDNGYAVLKATNATMNKTATKAAVLADFNGNGINQGAIWDIRSGELTALEDPSNNTCRLGSQQGISSNAIWDMDDSGNTIIGTHRVSYDGGECAEGSAVASIAIPTVWDGKKGKATALGGFEIVDRTWGSGKEIAIMDGDEEVRRTAWIRADNVSGDGSVVTGMTNGFGQVAWVDGKLRDLYTEFDAIESTAIANDGGRVAISTKKEGVKIWNTKTDELTEIGGLEYCTDISYIHFFYGNVCERFGKEVTWQYFGRYPTVTILDATDDLSIITARSGSLLSGGFKGSIYIDGIGWMGMGEFFGKQGVVEAKGLLTDNPFGLSANGSEMFAGLAGAIVTIDVDANKAFVCDGGVDKELSFPKQVVAAVKKGAEFGRCAHLDDRY